MKITGQEANILLLFDYFYVVNEYGKVLPPLQGPGVQYTTAELQALRDKLFGAHEHPPEDSVANQ